MTHDEYVSRIESFTDSEEDVRSVLAHSASCAICRREDRTAERALASLEGERNSLTEEIARWSAAAAILAVIVAGIRREPSEPVPTASPGHGARYVRIGDASGVVAYTPEGVVIGVSPRARGVETETTK
jgi:hypothetical protein